MKNFLCKLICYQFFLLFSFTGTAATKPNISKDPDSINMVYYRESAGELLKEALKQFEQESGYKVNLVFVNIYDLKQLLIKAAYNDSLPDIVLAPSDFASLASTIKLSKLPSDLLNPVALRRERGQDDGERARRPALDGPRRGLRPAPAKGLALRGGRR